MEKSFQNRTVANRIDTVQKHGTIEELIRRVTELSATVTRLEKALAVKDEEIAKLRSEKPGSEIQCSNSVISIPETPDTQDASFYNCSIDTPYNEQENMIPDVTTQCIEWLAVEGQSRENTKKNRNELKKRQKKKKRTRRCSIGRKHEYRSFRWFRSHRSLSKHPFIKHSKTKPCQIVLQ